VLGDPNAASVTVAPKATIVQESDGLALVRAYPESRSANGALAREIAATAAREGWKVEELHTEEGRLDEVFRSITSVDTSKQKETQS